MTTKTWTGGAGDFSANGNWSDNQPPQANDTGVFSSGTIQIGSITIAPLTTLLIGNGDYTVPLHVQLTDSTVDGLFHAVSGGANGDSEDYDIGGTVTLDGTIAASQDYGLLDINDLTAVPGTLVVGSGGTISSSTGAIAGNAADLNISVGTLVNNGLVAMTDAYGNVTSGTVTGSGFFTLAGSGDAIGLSFMHGVGNGITVQFAPATAAELVLPDPTDFAGTIAGLDQIDDIQFNNIQADAAVLSGGILTVTDAGSLVAAIKVAGAYPNGFTVNHTAFYGNPDANSSYIRAVACFAGGSLIRTTTGEIPVEQLRCGDSIVSAFGGTVRVQWIGQRRINCRRQPAAAPIRIRAHALADNVPNVDLLLSPEHAVYLESSLVPASCLLNGTTITREFVAEITYFHIELPQHDVIFASGAPCESYLDTGNRADFENAGEVITLNPLFATESANEIWQARACAPQCRSGERLDAIRSAIDQRAERFARSKPRDNFVQRASVRRS